MIGENLFGEIMRAGMRVVLRLNQLTELKATRAWYLVLS